MSKSTVGPEMDAACGASAGDIRFSTDSLPARHRLEMFREVFARSILGMEVEAIGERPFRTDMCIRQLPGLNIVWARNSPVRASRTRQLLADGNDSFAFQWSASPGFGERRGRELTLKHNDGILIACDEPGVLVLPRAAPMVSLTFPRTALGPLVRDIEDCAGRPVSAANPALLLLAGYVESLRRLNATPELQALAVSHVYDLLTMALAPLSKAAERNGVRAAQLVIIQEDTRENLHTELTIESVAARHGISTRHVQRLFEESGTTFTEFVRDARLERARAMLLSPRFARKRISDIAFEAGFCDLSHFNRWFRVRFGASPSDLRHRAVE